MRAHSERRLPLRRLSSSTPAANEKTRARGGGIDAARLGVRGLARAQILNGSALRNEGARRKKSTPPKAPPPKGEYG